MVAFFAFAGLLVFWCVFIALVKRERGRVFRSPYGWFEARMNKLAAEIGDQFLPAFVRLGEAAKKANDQMRELVLVIHLEETDD